MRDSRMNTPIHIALWSALLLGPALLATAAAEAQPEAAAPAAPTPPAAPAAPKAKAPMTLDQLLQTVRQDRVRETKENKEREAYFLANKNKQAQLLAEAKRALQQQQARSNRLSAKFKANEKQLTKLEEELRLAVGTLGELFGVVRQVAGDARGIYDNSLVSVQIKGRQAITEKLAQKKELPSISQLEELWYTMQQEMTESGKVVRFASKVVGIDGKEEEQLVTRVGVFNAFADGNFLRYEPETSQLVELARQPASRYGRMAKRLEDADAGITKVPLDPSRGAILSVLVQAPNLWEQIEKGRFVGYVIILLGLVGLGIVGERMWYLYHVEKSLKAQLASDKADNNNPLGRILTVFYDNKEADTETLELKIDESILRETPPLQRGLASIKILAVVAPLLGLLGTVTGMIQTFQMITLFGTGDPRLMADGISQALITTVLGLVVAIPLILLHSVVSSKSKQSINILDEQGAGLIAMRAEETSRDVRTA